MADEPPGESSESPVSPQTSDNPVQDLLQSTVERLARLDSNSQFLSVNQSFADLFGFSPEQMIGMSLTEICHADDCSKMIDLFVSMKTHGRSEGQLRGTGLQTENPLIRLVLIKGLEKNDSSYFCYCLVDLVSPDDRKKSETAVPATNPTLSQSLPASTTGEEPHFQKFQEQLDVIFWECDYPSLEISYVSSSIQRVLGYEEHEWRQKSKFDDDKVHPQDIEQTVTTVLESIKQKKSIFTLNYRLKNKHDQYLWVEDKFSVERDQHQNIVKLRGIISDNSAEKIYEHATTKSREKIFRFLDNVSEAMIETTLEDGIVTKVNSAFTELTGYARGDVLGRSLVRANILSANDYEKLYSELLRQGGVSREYVPFYNKSGEQSSLAINAAIISDSSSSFVLIAAQNSEQQKITDQLIRNAERKIRLISDSMPVAMSYLDEKLFYRFTNRSFDEIFNVSGQALVGKKIQDVVGQQEFNRIKPFVFRAMEGKRVDFEYESPDKFPSKCFEVCLIPNVDEKHYVSGVYIISQDITDKKKSKIREMKLGEILEKSSSEFMILDVESKRFVYANSGARENLGYSLAELRSQSSSNIIPELNDGYLADVFQTLSNNEQQEHHFSSQVIRKNKTDYTGEVTIQLSNIDNSPELVFIIKDITQNQIAEEKLQRADKILASTKDWVALVDKDYQYMYANQNYLDAINKRPEDLAKGTDVLQQLLFNTDKHAVLEKVIQGKSIHEQSSILLDNKKHYLDIKYFPYIVNQGMIYGILVSVRDITELRETKTALVQNEERFRMISMATNDALYDWDLINQKVWRNDKDFTNSYSSGDHREWYSIIHPQERQSVLQSFNEAVEKKNNYWTGEYRLKQIDGSYVDVLDRAYILYDDQKHPVRVMGAMTNITKRREIEEDYKASEERYRVLYQNNPLMLFSINAKGVITSMNQHVSKQLAYDDVDIVGEKIYAIVEPGYISRLTEAIEKACTHSDHIQRLELEIKHNKGGSVWVRNTIRTIHNNPKGNKEILIVCEDISENKRLSEQLSYQASHDSLTGLVNRAEFERRLERILQSMGNDGGQHALCYLDLDQFKVVNDTCGHLAGDELLRQISGILNNTVRKRDTLARLGGDEFGILMEHCTLEQAQRVANDMRKHIEEFRYIWEGKRFILGVSIGLVPIQSSQVDKSLHSVMREADVACYAAKDAGRNRVHIYSPNDGELSGMQGQVQWAAMINQALDEDRFSLYCQKIEPISIKEAVSVGEKFEILVRMYNDKQKLIQPSVFMPAAERYNLAVKIDTWVFKNLMEWMHSHPERVENIDMVSVNISGHSINNIQYLDFVLQKLYETNIPPNKICFEITETAAISNMSTALKLMQTIKSVGCKFSLDDFGSGVSSFSYLKQLPVDFLKIDGSFVKDVVDDPIDYEMVRSIKDVAKIMDMKTIAEYVQSEEIRSKLEEIGVDYGQGYCISKPEPL